MKLVNLEPVVMATSKNGNLTMRKKKVAVKLRTPTRLEELHNLARLKLGMINTLPIYVEGGVIHAKVVDGQLTFNGSDLVIYRLTRMYNHVDLIKIL